MWPPADTEAAGAPDGPQPQSLRALLPSREFLCSRKGRLLLGESVLSFIIFICYIASTAAPFLTVPLLKFLLALCFFFGYFMKINEKIPGICWPLSVVLPEGQDRFFFGLCLPGSSFSGTTDLMGFFKKAFYKP